MLVFLAALALAIGSCGGQAAKPKPYNVVFIMVDTLRADAMSLYGYHRPTTPNLEALAAKATVLENHFSQASCTFPSVNSTLTSRPPEHFLARADELGMVIPEDTPSIAEVFQSEGYATLAFSSSQIVRKTPSINRLGGFDRGFDVFDETCMVKSAYCINDAFAQTLSQLETTDPEQPFFAYLHYFEPHAPYRPPKWHTRRFATEPQTKRWVERGEGQVLMEIVYDESGREATPAEIQHLKNLYDDETLYFDTEIKNLLEDLESRDLLQRTIVVLVSDHGEAFLEHEHFAHCRDIAYDTTLRVPGMLLLPDVHPLQAASAGRRVQDATLNLDVAPTLLSLVGLSDHPLAQDFEGADLSRLWSSSPQAKPLHRFTTAVQGVNRVLRVGPYKLIYDVETEEGKLFNIQIDPLELDELSTRETDRYALMIGTMQRMLAARNMQDVQQGSAAIEDALQSLGYL